MKFVGGLLVLFLVFMFLGFYSSDNVTGNPILEFSKFKFFRKATETASLKPVVTNASSPLIVERLPIEKTITTKYGSFAVPRFVVPKAPPISKKHLELSTATSLDVSACTVIDTPGNYVLTTDLTGAPISNSPQGLSNSYSCIKITSSDVNLDCNGHAITVFDQPTFEGMAISVFSANNVNISSCSIYSNYNPSNPINYSRATNWNVTGVFLQDVKSAKVFSNKISSIDVGLNLTKSSNSIINFNTVLNAGTSIGSYQSYSNEISSNGISTSGSTTGLAVDLYNTSSTVIDSNNIYNTGNGIKIAGKSSYLNAKGYYSPDRTSSNNILSNNVILGNREYGVIFDSVNNNLLLNNSIYGNMWSGVSITLSKNIRLFSNTIFNNLREGVYISNSNSTWIGYNKISSSYRGIVIISGADNSLGYNNIYNNNYGTYITNSYISSMASITGDHYYGNRGGDIYIENPSPNPLRKNFVGFSDVVFDNPRGDFKDYTRFSMFDIVDLTASYVLSWSSSNSSVAPLPGNVRSF